MMIKFIISTLTHLWCDPISEAQKNYRKDHILDPYKSSNDWKDDIFWK